MRIVFLGLPLAAVLLLGDGHEVALAGLRKGLDVGKRRLARRGVPVVMDPHKDWEAFRARAEAARAELLVSWFFTRKIPMHIVRTCRLGGIGVHPSLLPRHRGPDPYFAAIDAGDEVTGVTVHRIDAEYDTGAILEQREVRLDPAWNAWELARRLDRPSLDALLAAVRRGAAGDQLRGEPQDDRLATDAPQPTDEDREIRWSQPAERIVRRIRALAPSPGALAFVGDDELTILAAKVADDVPRALEAGEAAIVAGRVIVRAGDRGVEVLKAEADGLALWGSDLANLVARASGK